ncbi:MAG TPA: DUF4440 domain-containing protein [Lysobacter sp.]
MRRLAVLSLLPLAALAQTPPAGPPVLSADECLVWQRELSFADALARHDAAAFAAHLHPDAAFGASLARPTRGRDAIAREWAGLVEGRAVRLEWYPTRTTIAGEPDIAFSSGPALFERLAPGPQPRYAMSQFRSVWHRGADGQWQVLFDDGTAPVEVGEAEALAFRAARPQGCPARAD